MTLVVYKNNMLAADTRATHNCTSTRNNTCAHCGEKAISVNDNKLKIHVFVGKREINFREDKLLAMASAGEAELINRIQRMIGYGKNIEEAYKNYLDIHGQHNDNKTTCTSILVGVNKNYILQIPKRGDLVVEEKSKDEFLAIGSGSHSAQWINKLLPYLDASAIINLAMHDDLSVGGNIQRIDFTQPVTEQMFATAEKLDPQSLLDAMVKVFQRGRDAMIEDQNKASAPARRSRKPATPAKGKE
jgi:ATP-dependent protease HslVU (ClpYQ) peptidase subunit